MTTALRIVQVVTRRQLRGAEVFAAQLGERLIARGHRVTLVGLYAPGEPPLEMEGGSCVDLGARPARLPSPLLVAGLCRVLGRLKPDLVQANGSDTLKVSVLARWGVRNPPLLVYRNISMSSSWLRGPLHRRLNRWLIHRVDHVATLSARTAADLAATYGLAAEAMSELPIGTSIPTTVDATGGRERIAACLSRPPTGPLLLHVGSMSREKDHATLLEAFARILPAHPECRLLLVGDGPLRDQVERRVRRLGLTDSVAFAGARGDARELIAGADLLLLPSRVEGMPGVLLEAAARGVPAVASAVGSVPEVVQHGATGLLTPPGDVAALAAAVETLLANPDLRDRFGAAARHRAVERYDLERVVDAFEALYLRLVEERRG